MARPAADDIHSTSSSITGTNPALYPAFQQYFRGKQPPFLAAWGKNDLFSLRFAEG